MNPKIQEYKENPHKVEKIIASLLRTEIHTGIVECVSLDEYRSLFTWDADYQIRYEFNPQYNIDGYVDYDSFEELKEEWEKGITPDAFDIEWEDALEYCGDVSIGDVRITISNLRLKDDNKEKELKQEKSDLLKDHLISEFKNAIAKGMDYDAFMNECTKHFNIVKVHLS